MPNPPPAGGPPPPVVVTSPSSPAGPLLSALISRAGPGASAPRRLLRRSLALPAAAQPDPTAGGGVPRIREKTYFACETSSLPPHSPPFPPLLMTV